MPADSDSLVLVIDDDPDTRSNLCDILELDDYHVETAGTVAEVLKRKDLDRVSAILLDRQLPDGNAEELLPHLRQLAPEAAVLVVPGYADLQGAIAALRQGAADYILKPINPDALRASLTRIVERRRLAQAKERSEAEQQRGRTASLREECSGVDLHCQVDAFWLEQVFRSILENALAACSDLVEITVFCSDSQLEGQPALRIAVRDNGPGLNPEQRQRIFEPFFTTKTKGTGLGMAIAQRIIEAHGGQIAIGMPPGREAEIQLLLPRGIT